MRTIIQQPGEDTPRLLYADWLDENATREYERDRAEFIRLQVHQARRDPCPYCVRSGGIPDVVEKKTNRGEPPMNVVVGYNRCYHCDAFDTNERIRELLERYHDVPKSERQPWMPAVRMDSVEIKGETVRSPDSPSYVLRAGVVWKGEVVDCGLPPSSIGPESMNWSRGFLGSVFAPVDVFMMRAGEIADCVPLEAVTLAGVKPILARRADDDDCRPWHSFNGMIRTAPYLGFGWVDYEVTRPGDYLNKFSYPGDPDVIPRELWDIVERVRDKPVAESAADSLKWLSWACVEYACSKSKDPKRLHWTPRPASALLFPPSLTSAQYDGLRQGSNWSFVRPDGMARVKSDYAYDPHIRLRSAHDLPANDYNAPGWG